ncbi:hypothetical protein RND71_011208 [Anisodus tanguticus]|uniref:GDSL esterase/lipase n=1 Tax=Anisodus tanguticus TaxID=243964 RepID=A0AAE1SEF4_9SOLA|nr:hypothetical protein RND71_011208 [Anisodus tanguticus]
MRSRATMECARVMFLLLLSLVLLAPFNISSAAVATNAKPPCNFPAIYNFGDSNSDTAGISATFEPIQAPYGESFFRKPAGRFSDGRLLIDFIAIIRWLEFNRQLKARIRTLRAELGHAAITYVDVYAAKYELISNTKNQGFVEPQKICCGVHEGNTHVWCGQKGIVRGEEVFGGACTNPSGYISWDGVHYSQAANHWIADHILNGSFSDPLIPITHACHTRLHH